MKRPDAPTWTLTVGGLSRDDLLLALTSEGIALNAYAALLFSHTGLWNDLQERTLTLVSVTPRELGLPAPAVFGDIVTVASRHALHLCPLHAAAHLALALPELADDVQLTVATEAAFDDERYPRGFYLRRNGEQRWLRGYRASADWPWPVDSQLLFSRSAHPSH